MGISIPDALAPNASDLSSRLDLAGILDTS